MKNIFLIILANIYSRPLLMSENKLSTTSCQELRIKPTHQAIPHISHGMFRIQELNSVSTTHFLTFS
jgi:hypothetical protein